MIEDPKSRLSKGEINQYAGELKQCQSKQNPAATINQYMGLWDIGCRIKMPGPNLCFEKKGTR